MSHEELKRQLAAKLNPVAQQHPEKAQVIAEVLQRIQPAPSGFWGLWKMTGFALAAAITGFVVLPGAVDVSEKNNNQVLVSPKLSPQMLEDLEMLSVLGEVQSVHGS